MTLRRDDFIEKCVRPPMGADPVLKGDPASIMPAGITHMNPARMAYMNMADGKDGFFPLSPLSAPHEGSESIPLSDTRLR